MLGKGLRFQRGFTLVELITIVLVLGALAAVAGQGYRRFVLKSKVSEAPINLKEIRNGEVLYYSVDHLDGNQQLMGKHFLALPQTTGTDVWTPTPLPCENGSPRYAKDSSRWDKNGWSKIQFGINTAHFYQYQVKAAGTGLSATFTITARSNFDCDNVFGRYRLYGSVDNNGQPVIQGMIISNSIE